MTIKNSAVSDKIKNLVLLLQKHKKNPSDKLFQRIENDLKIIQNELKNSWLYLTEPHSLDILLGKIDYMMQKNTKLSRKYRANRFQGR